MDHQLFLAINGLAGKSHLLDVVGTFVGGDKFLYLFTLVVILLWFNKRVRRYVYLGLGSALVARGIVAEVLKRLVHRPRPFEVLNVHQLIVDNEKGTSFPSGHATVYFALAFAFWGTEYFWPLFTAAIVGSVGRVFVGVHYPVDILAGAVISGLTVWVLRRFFKKWFLPERPN